MPIQRSPANYPRDMILFSLCGPHHPSSMNQSEILAELTHHVSRSSLSYHKQEPKKLIWVQDHALQHLYTQVHVLEMYEAVGRLHCAS